MGGVNLWKCLSGLQRIRERGHAGRKGGVPTRWGSFTPEVSTHLRYMACAASPTPSV